MLVSVRKRRLFSDYVVIYSLFLKRQAHRHSMTHTNRNSNRILRLPTLSTSLESIIYINSYSLVQSTSLETSPKRPQMFFQRRIVLTIEGKLMYKKEIREY